MPYLLLDTENKLIYVGDGSHPAEWIMSAIGGVPIKKARRRYDREFKIPVVAELESGKPLAQIAREALKVSRSSYYCIVALGDGDCENHYILDATFAATPPYATIPLGLIFL